MPDLPKRTLGRTGLRVSVLAYGSMELRGPPKGRSLDEAQIGRILNAVLDQGIDLIDTSIDYGAAEGHIGRHIGHRRGDYVLASKCGCSVGWEPEPGSTRGVGPHDYSRANIVAGVEQSLRRLATDHLDVLQIHLSPSVEVMEQHGVVETLHHLQEQGKVRFIGMSGTLPHLPEHIAMDVFDVFQIPYSIVQPEHESYVAAAAAVDAGVIIRGGAARGVPSGGERPLERNPELAEVWTRAGLTDLLDGMSPMEFTLRSTMTHPGMTTNIVGTVDPSHLAANVAAVARGPLPPDVTDEARRRVATTTAT
jgi:aryl-alcohol dehydrogenase-like predicted oxidoreductase